MAIRQLRAWPYRLANSLAEQVGLLIASVILLTTLVALSLGMEISILTVSMMKPKYCPL